MIVYPNHSFGIHSLLRVHGSAIYKCLIPALVSTAILISVVLGFRGETQKTWGTQNAEDRATTHPSVIGVFVAFYSLLVAFRLNFSYGRYWEGATSVYTMTSRWLDCAMTMSAFHYQCIVYEHLQPPSFGNHDNTKLHNLTRERERRHEMTLDEALLKYEPQQQHPQQQQQQSATTTTTTSGGLKRRRQRQRQSWFHSPGKLLFPSQHQQRKLDTEQIELYSVHQKKVLRNSIAVVVTNKKGCRTLYRKESSIPVPDSYLDEENATTVLNDKTKDSNNDEKPPVVTAANRSGSPPPRMLYKMKGSSLLVPALHKAPIPSLFLQELAHLVSLLSAVAMSTLRNPLEGTESPLARYIFNKPWPPVDADTDQDESVRTNYQTFYEDMLQDTFLFMGQRRRLWTSLYFLLGLSRSPSQRALYNAARPFTVLGGVSDEEIDQLQMARGPSAKVALCVMWVQEFITREYLAGSTGKVGAPLVSDVYAFLSDGFAGYNAARRIAYIPFPFPEAQIDVFFSLTVLIVFPFLYASYVNSLPLACVINFGTVICFLGMTEVSRELENPFMNVPNDLPLLHFQAQFNEALICMYAGFHPDSWWEETAPLPHSSSSSSLEGGE